MISKRKFSSSLLGKCAYAYTISNGLGFSVTVLDYGATLQSVVVPHGGKPVDILLGYDTLHEYKRGTSYLGASIGRFAGRIPYARFRIDDFTYPVTKNEGGNTLHGGRVGFDRRFWDAETGDDSVTFTLRSLSGEEGFPGSLTCSATYTLCDNVLTLTYHGKADRSTAWNPTNHGYWNLNGHGAGDTRAHLLEIPADRYIPVGADMLPTGGETDVSGTKYDFRTLRPIVDEYDNCFVLNGGPIRLFGESGIGLEIETDCAAVQFYNARFLPEGRGKGGSQYGPFGAVCLETEGRQTLKDLRIYEENILRPHAEKTHTTQFRFVTKED